MTLPPGAALMWAGTSELWAVTDAGESAIVELLFTGSGSFVPGPSSVSINKRVSSLYNGVVTPASQNTTVFDSSALGIDLSPYSSIQVYLQVNENFSSPSTFLGKVSTKFLYDNPLYGNYKDYYFHWTGGISITADVTSNNLQVILSLQSLVPATYTVQVTGYSERQTPSTHMYPITIPDNPYYTNLTVNSSTLDPQGFAGFDFQLTATGLAVAYLPSTSGPNYAFFDTPGSGTWTLQYFKNAALPSARIVNYVSTTTLTTVPPTPIFLREYPIVLLNNGSAGQRAIFTLTNVR
jgi:hypothetical protein